MVTPSSGTSFPEASRSLAITRPVTFVLSGMMAVAYFMAHASDAFWPILNGGELAVLYCFVFFFLSAHGGGGFSLDGWLRSRKAAQNSAG